MISCKCQLLFISSIKCVVIGVKSIKTYISSPLIENFDTNLSKTLTINTVKNALFVENQFSWIQPKDEFMNAMKYIFIFNYASTLMIPAWFFISWYSSGINHMWILKNSKDLLDNLNSRSLSQVSSIKTFDFSSLYTTLPHDKLKIRLKETIQKAFNYRNNGSKFVVLGYNSTYFQTKFKKVKHATPRNKWSVCWSSSSITYLSPLEGHCFNRSSTYHCVRIVPLF